MKALFRLLAALFVAFTLSAAPAPAADKIFRAGAHAMDTTPLNFPVWVNGSMRGRMAESAHDPMHARCLVLDDGETVLAIAIVDLCMIPREIVDAAKQRITEAIGVPPQNILIAATHTHSAPAAAEAFQSLSNPDYLPYLTQRIAEGIIQAHENLEPAQIGWAVGHDPTQVFNRRWRVVEGKSYLNPFGSEKDRARMNPGFNSPIVSEPIGPVDPEVPVVSLRSKDGKPIALLANYSLHYVGGNPALSADYFAAFADRFAKLIDAPESFVGIMSNGTSGDINNVDYSVQRPKREPGEQIAIVADSVANAALEAYRKINYHDWVDLDARQEELEFAVRKAGPEELVRAREILDKALKPQGVLTKREEIYARESVLLDDYPETVKFNVQAMRIGDLGITAIPCEVFVEIGLELKKRSPFETHFTIELANGYNGYLPTPDQHALGGYETWRARSSYLETGASPKIVASLMRLMKQF